MLPAAGFADAALPPEASCPVEIKEPARSTPGRLFQDEMSIQQDRLSPRQPGVRPIDVAPSCLNHPYLRIGEIVDALPEDVGRWNEVGIQNEEKFSLCILESVIKCAGFESDPILPVQNHRVKPAFPEVGDRR